MSHQNTCQVHKDKNVEYECKKDNSRFCEFCLGKHFGHIDQVIKLEDQLIKETIQYLKFNIEMHKARVDQCYQQLFQIDIEDAELDKSQIKPIFEEAIDILQIPQSQNDQELNKYIQNLQESEIFKQNNNNQTQEEEKHSNQPQDMKQNNKSNEQLSTNKLQLSQNLELKNVNFQIGNKVWFYNYFCGSDYNRFSGVDDGYNLVQCTPKPPYEEFYIQKGLDGKKNSISIEMVYSKGKYLIFDETKHLVQRVPGQLKNIENYTSSFYVCQSPLKSDGYILKSTQNPQLICICDFDVKKDSTGGQIKQGLIPSQYNEEFFQKATLKFEIK